MAVIGSLEICVSGWVIRDMYMYMHPLESESDQELPQSLTTDQSMGREGRYT